MSTPVTDPRSFHVPADARPAPPPPARQPGGPPRPRRWPWVLGGLFAVAVLGVAYLGFSAWSTWRTVERVELAGVLQPSASATNYLVIGTDSREGVDPDNRNAGAIFGDGSVAGERTDTIAVMRVDGSDVSLLAIPRDLYVDIGGGPDRINAAFSSGGPAALVAAVQRELGLGIDHYLEVDFAGFLDLVDALGGVTIELPHPSYDSGSGWRADQAGPIELDGDAALAFVRSRHYVEIVDGVERRDLTSDLGRVQRQQQFLAAVFAALGETRNPFTLLSALDGVADNVRVDHGMGFTDVLRLGWTLRGAEPSTETVPSVPHTTAGGAQVLLISSSEAAPVLDRFR